MRDQRFGQFVAEVERLLDYERQQSGFTLDISHRLLSEADDVHDAMRTSEFDEGRRSAVIIAARAFLLAEACGYGKEGGGDA